MPKRRLSLTLVILKANPTTLTRKLLAMGATSLLTERRGFDGLDGPLGQWLEVFGGTAYMPATMDKTLASVALLNVCDDMWRPHAGRSSELTGR